MELVLCLSGVVVVGVLMFYLGVRHGRASQGPPAADREQLISLADGLSRWASDVSTDVSQFREIVEEVARHAARDGKPTVPSGATNTLLAPLVDANLTLQRKLDAAEATLKRQAGDLASYMSEARTDPLTQLNNRRMFDDELARRLADVRGQSRGVGVMLIDVDHFKRLNDTHGHPAGDAVLQRLSRLLGELQPPGSLIARFGGEEFAVVLPATDVTNACALSERLRAAVENAAFDYGRQSLKITISSGVALSLASEDTPSLIKRCDDALYAAKTAGRNAVCYHDGVRSCRFDANLPERIESGTHEETLAREFDEVCQDLRSRLSQLAGVGP